MSSKYCLLSTCTSSPASDAEKEVAFVISEELSVSAKPNHQAISGGRKEGQTIEASEQSVASGLHAMRKNWYLNRGRKK